MSQHYAVVPSAHVATRRTSPRRAIIAFGAALTAVTALALGAVTLGPASPAHAHDQLVNTEIVAKSDGTAEAVRLSFSNSIIEVGTEFVLTAPDGSDAKGGDPVVTGPDVTQPIATGLKAGDYAGAWRVVSSDGHPIDGAFTLTLAADGSATVTDGVAPEHTDESGDAHEAEAGHEAGDHKDAADQGSGLGAGAIIGLAGSGVVIVALGVTLIARRRGATAAATASSPATPATPARQGDTTEGSN